MRRHNPFHILVGRSQGRCRTKQMCIACQRNPSSARPSWPTSPPRTWGERVKRPRRREALPFPPLAEGFGHTRATRGRGVRWAGKPKLLGLLVSASIFPNPGWKASVRIDVSRSRIDFAKPRPEGLRLDRCSLLTHRFYQTPAEGLRLDRCFPARTARGRACTPLENAPTTESRQAIPLGETAPMRAIRPRAFV